MNYLFNFSPISNSDLDGNETVSSTCQNVEFGYNSQSDRSR